MPKNLTIDEVLDFLLANNIRQVEIDFDRRRAICTEKSGDQYELGFYLDYGWRKSNTSQRDNECRCPCHCGGWDGAGTCKQPCDNCECVD